MANRKKKRPLKRTAASLTHRVSKSYTNGRRWVITEQPKEQELPAIDEGRHWYVVRVGTCREEANEKRLTEKGFTTFLPRYVRTARRQAQERRTEPVLVPGYLFVASDGSDGEHASIIGVEAADLSQVSTFQWHDRRTGECFQVEVRGVPVKVECEILRSRTTFQPIKIPEGLMKAFVGRVSNSTKQSSGALTPITFAKGSTVRVSDGPFATFLAEVEAVDKGLARILVDIFGRKSHLELPIASLEAA